MAKKVVFTQRCKHGTYDFAEGTCVEFATAKTGQFFIALGAAEAAGASATATIKLSAADITIDPNTVWASGPDRGKRVL